MYAILCDYVTSSEASSYNFVALNLISKQSMHLSSSSGENRKSQHCSSGNLSQGTNLANQRIDFVFSISRVTTFNEMTELASTEATSRITQFKGPLSHSRISICFS